MKTVRLAGLPVPILPARIWIPLAIVAVAAGAYFGLWDGWLKDRFVPKNWGEVETGKIFRSARLHTALVERTLARNGVRVVITMEGRDLSDPEHAALEDTTKKLGIELKRFPMKGTGMPGDGEIIHHAEAIAAIKAARDAGKPVLVQCAAGSYRTGGVVAGYRLLVEGTEPGAVYQEMVDYGWDPEESILADFLNVHMAELAERLQGLGTIAAEPDPLPILREASKKNLTGFRILMLVIGFSGQGIFGLRFVVQWIATEKRQRVTIPLAFWYLSIAGTLLLMAWAIYRLDPVLIPGFSLNLIIYLRNLYFAHHPRGRKAASPAPHATDGE